MSHMEQESTAVLKCTNIEWFAKLKCKEPFSTGILYIASMLCTHPKCTSQVGFLIYNGYSKLTDRPISSMACKFPIKKCIGNIALQLK